MIYLLYLFDLSLSQTYIRQIPETNFPKAQNITLAPLHYLFTKNFIPSPPETRAFKDLEIPEGERGRAKEFYIRPNRKPLYSLQVECLIVISRALHLYKERNSLTYNFQDTEDKSSYWSFTIPSSVPKPVGFDLKQYTSLELARYIKPRLQNWIKASGLHTNIKEDTTEVKAEPFYIDLWEIIDKEEIRILDWRFVKEERKPLDWYIETFKNVSQQKTNKKSGQKRKYSSNT